ncbi:hypothetical protein PI124_g6670 [Phytophthora idaei]|nr:hypothetical protein PI124_g6670 [Phytophthora idaei]
MIVIVGVITITTTYASVVNQLLVPRVRRVVRVHGGRLDLEIVAAMVVEVKLATYVNVDKCGHPGNALMGILSRFRFSDKISMKVRPCWQL